MVSYFSRSFTIDITPSHESDIFWEADQLQDVSKLWRFVIGAISNVLLITCFNFQEDNSILMEGKRLHDLAIQIEMEWMRLRLFPNIRTHMSSGFKNHWVRTKCAAEGILFERILFGDYVLVAIVKMIVLGSHLPLPAIVELWFPCSIYVLHMSESDHCSINMPQFFFTQHLNLLLIHKIYILTFV